ncbi:lipase [Bacillus manliponensis]|uniref:lipase family protein n=1 Tax=Bacillus manliponensis TaxID=574376 RepID=UPI003513AAF7
MSNKVSSISSDRGKLKLAGEDIYWYNEGIRQYDGKDRPSKEELADRFRAKIIHDKVDPKTGFAAYALQSEDTGEVVIVYVGTQPGKDGRSDLWEDVQIGANNIFNSWFVVEQYDQGIEFYNEVKSVVKEELPPGTKITITGHSLGGGIGLTVALRNQEEDINVLALNPAPLLNKDVIQYGDGSQLKNSRSIINENDPLYGSIKVMDFVLPGMVYMIDNDAGHSYLERNKDYNKDGNLLLDKLKSGNETGFDGIPSFLELSLSAGNLYKGLTGKKDISRNELLGLHFVLSTQPLNSLLHGLTTINDISVLARELGRSGVGKEAIKFCTEVINEIRNTVDEAIDWIETNLVRCGEVVMQVLESVFDRAVDFLAGCIAVYLTLGEIREIATEVAASLVQDILDLFEGDFVLDTSITAIVGDHIRSNRNALTNLFMNDSRRGIDRSLLNEVAKDIKEFSEELKELSDDVSLAVVSMVAKDEELHAVKYH